MSIASVCCRKRRHVSRSCALKALAAQQLSMPPCLPVCQLNVYKCPYCTGWHVGHELPTAIIERSITPVEGRQ